MTVDLEAVLRRVTVNKASRGYLMQPPCKPGELETLRYELKQRFRMDVPRGYEDLLRITNGIDFNGTLIFAAKTTPHVNRPGKVIEGLIEANDIRRENADQLLIFGESGMEMYAYNLQTDTWGIVDEVSLDLYERFNSFDDLIATALRKRLT
jgi:hypothetical protein